MHLSPDFSSLITTPYLPILGPVHPTSITSDLINELFVSSSENKLLPYDKARRWQTHPDEIIQSHLCRFSKSSAIIVTTTSAGLQREYIYGDTAQPLTPAISGSKQRITFNSQRTQTAPHIQVSVVFLANLEASNGEQPMFAQELKGAIIQQLSDLGDNDEQNAFGRLITTGFVANTSQPIIVIVENNLVLGAIGPLTIQADANGIPRLLPCYFGVHNSARRRGIGRRLWALSVDWATSHGAKYTIIQASPYTPAHKFYTDLGLQDLGTVVRSTL